MNERSTTRVRVAVLTPPPVPWRPDTLSIELNTRVVYMAPGWSVVSTIDGRVFSRHATRAQAQDAARRLCARDDLVEISSPSGV
jgi:hypothetical protein